VIPDPPFLAPRSGHWPAVRHAHLQKEPACAVCGDTDSPDVHHVVPVHVDPARELDPTNLMTLCRHDHWVWGHYCDWLSCCPTVRSDAAIYRGLADRRPRPKVPERSLAMFAPYPDSLPTADTIGLVTAALRGQGVDPHAAAHAVWTVVGFGLGQWDAAGGTPASAAAAQGQPLDRAQAAQLLESHVVTRQAAAAPGMGLPWGRIIQTLLPLLLELLSKGAAG
jgi:hypothetical protein